MKLVFDISTVARRAGIPGGIGRVEREFALYALEKRPDIAFSFFDNRIGEFRQPKRQWLSELIGTEVALDTSRIPVGPHARRQLRHRLPASLAAPAFWTRRFRHNLQVALERVRLTSRAPMARTVAARLLPSVARSKRLRDPSIVAPTVLPFDTAIGEPFQLDDSFVLVSVGNDWAYKDADQIAQLKARRGFRYVVLCHDLIIIQFPELMGDQGTAVVRRFWERMFPLVDLLIFTTQTVKNDVLGFCRENNIPLGESAIVRLGWDPASFSLPSEKLPAGLEPDKYILLVSSLDLRKGHDLMIRVWRRLIDEGIPQSLGFKLVFVGEHGINTPDLKDKLQRGNAAPALLHFHGVTDRQLVTFYRHAAFCVYPSRYEGFGLPAVEALGAGKALITSTGGAIPEVVDGFAPCLDPHDEEAWYRELKRWMLNPGVRRSYEERIRAGFSMPTWTESAERFFTTIASWADASSD